LSIREEARYVIRRAIEMLHARGLGPSGVVGTNASLPPSIR
jgi:hypothetical protein